MNVTTLLYLLQRFGLGIGLFIFKKIIFFHTSPVYHSEFVEITTAQNWLICTSREFTLIYVNHLLH